MRFRQRGLVAYISVAHGFIHTIEITYAVLLSRIGDDLGSDLFTLGIIANGFAFMFGFAALPSGVLVDRFLRSSVEWPLSRPAPNVPDPTYSWPLDHSV